MRTEKRARAARWLKGSGIEIGALHNPLPVPEGVEVRYVDRASEPELRRHYPELAGEPLVPVSILGDAEDLTALADGSVDFVIANHLLEHLENPIRGLQEMARVLRQGGVLYVALPDPRATFDRQRPLTPIDHVLEEFREGTASTRTQHYSEWVELVEPLIARFQEEGVGSGPARVRELLEMDYSIHFHVWRPETFLEVLVSAARVAGVELEPLEFVPCDREADDEYIFVLQKGYSERPPEIPPLPSDLEVRRLHATIAEMSVERDRLAQECARTARRLDEERDARARSERAVTALTGSRSWRMTVPLRAAAAAARRIRRGQ